jgi:NDP-sugar pyrophosphorylase family protein
MDAVVMAAGEGSRLRPLTERWAKPVLPIDGRPVIATLLRELAAAGCSRVTVVTGHLAEQVELLVGDGSAFGLDVRTVRQPQPDGSADAVVRAGVEPPFLVSAADTLFAAGDVGRFLAAADGGSAIGIRRQPGRPEHTRIRVDGGRVARVVDPTADEEWTAAPLMLVGAAVAARLREVVAPPYEPPYELAVAFQLAIDAGEPVAAVELGRTRDLTRPVDLVQENFPYARGLT